MNLRDQITSIGARAFGHDYAKERNWPSLVDDLCRKAFMDRWPDGVDTAAIRRAAEMLHGYPGWVDADEPPVLSPFASRIRDEILEHVEETRFLEPSEFDEAIIGIADRCASPTVVAYDRDKVVEVLSRSMSLDAAIEFFEFNTLGAFIGERTPVFVTRMRGL